MSGFVCLRLLYHLFGFACWLLICFVGLFTWFGVMFVVGLILLFALWDLLLTLECCCLWCCLLLNCFVCYVLRMLVGLLLLCVFVLHVVWLVFGGFLCRLPVVTLFAVGVCALAC